MRIYRDLNSQEDEAGIDFFIVCCLIIIVISMVFKIFFPLVQIRGNSMYPTLHDGDYYLTNKSYVRNKNNIKRGDIVVAKAGDNYFVIKRVIGLPGEKVEISTSGQVKINGKVLNEPYINHNEYTEVASGDIDKSTLHYVDETEYGKLYQRVFFHEVNRDIPNGHYFLMGDNRIHSEDSRFYGPVSQNELMGKLISSKANYSFSSEDWVLWNIFP